MSEASIVAIIVPVLSGIMTIIGVVISNHYSNWNRTDEFKAHINEQFFKTDYQIDLIKKDIEALDEKQEKHNKVIERVGVVEKNVAVLTERIDSLDDAINRN